MNQPLSHTDLKGIKLLRRGKVRDLYDLGDSLLMVATDRLSAFDVVLPDPIPEKGRVLTRISLFWFEQLSSLVKNHVITSQVEAYPDQLAPYAEMLRGRSMIVRKAEPLPVECVVRGYLSGSGWKAYQESQSVCGIGLPPGLKESDPLPRPIFTPSTKEEVGSHDINIDFQGVVERIGRKRAEQVRELSLEIYARGVEIAAERGIIIADTKFEFGLFEDEIILIDEVLTPDSSRFWPRATYAPGGAQESFDKQYVRDYLLSLEWDRREPGPSLPADVIEKTRRKYLEVLTLFGVDE